MSIWNFFTPEAGQQRRQWLEGQAEGLLTYVPPELRPWLMIANEVNPVTSMERAGEASNRMVAPGMSGWDRMAAAGDMLSNVAGVVAPAIGAKAGAVPVANAVEEVLTGYAPMVQPFLADESGAFAGLRALTADRAAYDRAVDMASRGASRDDIWNATGWFKGVDGKWRFEIDDSAAQLHMVPMAKRENLLGRTVGANMDHQELWSAYPDLARDWFQPVPPGSQKGVRGSYQPPNDGVSRGVLRLADNEPSEMRSTALHELQHAIQGREGFARGGNIDDGFVLSQDIAASRASRAQDELERMVSALPEALQRQFNMFAFSEPSDEMRRRFMLNEQLAPVVAKFDEVRQLNSASTKLTPESALDAYRRLAGEVEARNVQSRLGMTADQRRATPPWATQDTPDDMQILRGLLNQ